MLAIVGLVDAVVAFKYGTVIPIVEPFLAGLGALVLTIGYRFIVADKNRRLLQKSFGLYLAPDVINRMLSSNKLPELGGETREVTVFFSDIEGFSKIAEQITPDSLTALMNEYLSAMTDIIESHGGYVDKYIGDFIVAVFGAPADDPNHAANAARAALDCCAKLAELNRDSAAFQEHPLAQRIGINSGDAVVGNLGSRRRFNYSVMGDAVNLASRLEGANKFYGTTIIASETTVQLAGDAFAWRELDAIRVKGRTQALKIYELLALSSELTEAQQKSASDYAEGLAHWRAREFSAAAASFGRQPTPTGLQAMFRDPRAGTGRLPAGCGLGSGPHASGKIGDRGLRPARGRSYRTTPRSRASWSRRLIIQKCNIARSNSLSASTSSSAMAAQTNLVMTRPHHFGFAWLAHCPK